MNAKLKVGGKKRSAKIYCGERFRCQGEFTKRDNFKPCYRTFIHSGNCEFCKEKLSQV